MWKPGQSGNPSGRSNVPREINAIFEGLLSAFPDTTPAELVMLKSLAKLQHKGDHTRDHVLAHAIAGEVRRSIESLRNARRHAPGSLPSSRAFDEALARKAAHVG